MTLDQIATITIRGREDGLDDVTRKVNNLATAQQNVAVSSDRAGGASLDVSKKYVQMQRSLDMSFRAAQDFEKVQKTINLAQQQGVGTTAEHNRLMDLAAQRYVQTAAAGGLARHEMINLSRQFQDVVVSLQAGQNPFTVLVQQGSQIADVFASSQGTVKGFFGQVATAARAFITPVTATVAATIAATAAVAALALQYDRLQVSSQRALIGAGQRTGTTVSDLNQFTQQNSAGFSGSSLSTKEARQLGEDLTKTGEIVIGRLHGMSDAVVGFANQTDKSMEEARKAMVGFATDPQKAIGELAKVYGDFDVATRKAVDALVLAGDKTAAFQVVIDALSEKSKAAAQNMGALEKSGRAIVNVLATETVKPKGLESELSAAQGRLSEAKASPFQGTLGQASIRTLQARVDGLQAAFDKVNASKAAAEINHFSTEAEGAAKAIIPQIEQIEQLRKKLAQLDRAKAAGTAGRYGAEVDNAASIEIQNQIAGLQQSQEQTARYNDRVKEISASWGDVGQATALALQAQQNQLPVIQAVGGAAKMASQFGADYANAIDQGRTASEAAATAAMNLAMSQAQATSQAQSQLAALRDQAAISSARNVNERISAQAQATLNGLLREGVDLETAMAVAAQQSSNAHAEVYQQMQKQVRAAQDMVDLARAQGSSDQARVQSDIAYRKAMEGGATAAQAAAISVDTMQASLISAAQAADQVAEAEEAAAHAAFKRAKDISEFTPEVMTGIRGDLVNIAGLNANTQLASRLGADNYGKLERVGGNPYGRVLNPEVLFSLTDSIKDLTKSTDALTAVNQATLNPFYSEGHSALGIGYYKAATGLEGIVGGSGSTDSTPVHMMLTPGEHIKVTPPGQPTGASNDNSKITNNTIVQNFNFSNPKGAARLSQRQFAQGFGQATAALS